jgi:hypothetical protein
MVSSFKPAAKWASGVLVEGKLWWRGTLATDWFIGGDAATLIRSRIGWAESVTVCGGLSMLSFRYRQFELQVCPEAMNWWLLEYSQLGC